jgi:hypothetical protein
MIAENFLIIIFFVFQIVFIIFALFFIVFFTMLIFYLRKTGVPFVKSEKNILEKIKKLDVLKDGMMVADLGSGDGSFLYFLAKDYPNVQFVGYEINPMFYQFSKVFQRLPNLKFYRQDFFKIDLGQFDCLYLFLYPSILEKLLPKIQKEAKKNCYIITNSFNFKNLEPVKKNISSRALSSVYIYQL